MGQKTLMEIFTLQLYQGQTQNRIVSIETSTSQYLNNTFEHSGSNFESNFANYHDKPEKWTAQTNLVIHFLRRFSDKTL